MTTHTLQITNGGVALLKEILAAPTWYEGKPLPLVLAAATLNENLSVHEVPKARDGETQSAFDERADEWANLPIEILATEKQRDATKECVRYFLSKAALRLSRHVVKLIETLGLGE